VAHATDSVILSGAQAESKDLRTTVAAQIKSVPRSFDSFHSLRMTAPLALGAAAPGVRIATPLRGSQ